MKKWLIILWGTESIKKNVHKLSYEPRSIQEFESWHLDQKWALRDFLKFMTEMEKQDLINVCEEKVSGKMFMLHQQVENDLQSHQKFESSNLDII